MKGITLLGALLLLAAPLLAQQVWVVSPEGDLSDPQMAFYGAAAGDTIRLRPGEYFAETFDLRGKTDLVILGEEAHLLGTSSYGTVLSVNSCRNIVIDGLHLRHELGPQWTYCMGGVLEIVSSQNVLVTGCELNGCGAYGLDVYASMGVIATGCYLHHNNHAAVRYEFSEEINEAPVTQFEGLLLYDNAYEANGTVTFLYSRVEQLRLRNAPVDGETMGFLQEGQRVYDLEKRSDAQSTIELRGQQVTDVWYQVQTDSGLTGWVFGGALADSYDPETLELEEAEIEYD